MTAEQIVELRKACSTCNDAGLLSVCIDEIERLQADNARLAALVETVRAATFLEVAQELRNGANTPKSHRLAWAKWCEGNAARLRAVVGEKGTNEKL